MDTAQTEKLKALALAYSYENGEHWFNEFELADGVTYEPGVNFIIAANPATVLALIAEVERLRADRDKTLEDAATVADAERAEFMSKAGANNGRESDFAFGSVNSAERIAASIRALKGAAITASKEKA